MSFNASTQWMKLRRRCTGSPSMLRSLRLWFLADLHSLLNKAVTFLIRLAMLRSGLEFLLHQLRQSHQPLGQCDLYLELLWCFFLLWYKLDEVDPIVVDEASSSLESCDDDDELELEDELGSDGGDGLLRWVILCSIHSVNPLGNAWLILLVMGLWNVVFCCAFGFVPW